MEGPSLVILKEEVAHLAGQTIISATGDAKIDYAAITGQRIKEFRSFGKHFLLVFEDVTVRIHFLMFGSYRINETKDRPPRLALTLQNDTLNFYTCSVRVIEGDINDLYDWRDDVMSPEWDEKRVRRKLKKHPEMNVGDALLDQSLFPGVGNIIKNEVLFRIQVHPQSTLDGLPPRKLTALIREARTFCFDFYNWKKVWQLRKHLLIYKKKKCRRCSLPVVMEHTGANPRLTFFCNHCQAFY